MKGFRTFAIS